MAATVETTAATMEATTVEATMAETTEETTAETGLTTLETPGTTAETEPDKTTLPPPLLVQPVERLVAISRSLPATLAARFLLLSPLVEGDS